MKYFKRYAFGAMIVSAFAVVLVACGGGSSSAGVCSKETPSGGAGLASEAGAWSSSDYSQALITDANTLVDTSGCKKDGPFVIGGSHQDTSNGWGNTYNVSFNGYGQELKDAGILKFNPLVAITNDADQQIADIENLLAQNPDALVVEPLGRAASTAIIERAVNQGVPVVLCANGIEGSVYTSRVDIDFWEAGYRSFDALAKSLNGSGNVLIFNGIQGVDSTETWHAAALDAHKNYPNINIIATEYASWNVDTAKSTTESLMAGNQIDGVWAGGGEMALGAALAFEDADVPQPKYGMVNVPNGFLRLAKKYSIQFTGAPDPPAMSAQCLQAAVDILQGKTISKFIDLRFKIDGAKIYDETSLDRWYRPDLSDDFIPPATVDESYYLESGFGRK